MPYQPCDGRVPGSMVTWPHLVGKPAAEAKTIIEREHLEVTAFIIPVAVQPNASAGLSATIPRYQIRIDVFRANRVWLYVNDDRRKTVAVVPRIG
ncbi:hypothetical protein MKW98_001464 [Papaver atlanticum]|uniref:Uncharacterized protein n=1 Tax=Papaver atlanticum TaxID=357466 RepID=A0AAD4SWZ4_9MAGN|nr:hypothetical protein MKW98_001464 [Papaver atlanticum]